jgi:23S rRNA (cytosine1962-C5)-methyltransferase
VGIVCGEDIVDHQEIEENGVRFLIDVKEGHKTGFYLDQRANRLRVRELAIRKEVLDCFSYSGGFTINAFIGGAVRVTMIESSGEALELARKNLALNQLDESKVDIFEADVFEQLRKFRDQNRQFDLIVLDPPKFAPTRAHVEKAARGYKDINLLAFKLLRPGGILVTFSCSGGLSIDLFQKIVAGAALDAGVDAQITERLFQDVDHPVALNFPEGEYLKGLVCRVL